MNKKIGFISFSIGRKNEVLAKRTKCIECVIQERKPDLLIGSGWSLPTKRRSERIQRSILETSKRTTVFLESEENSQVQIISHSRIQSLTHQKISNSQEARTFKGDSACAKLMKQRVFEVGSVRVGVLVCGEVYLFVLGGAAKEYRIRRNSELVRNWVASVDLIYHPIHLPMTGQQISLNGRRWLSKQPEEGLYLSSSNFRTRPSKTTHIAFRDGVREGLQSVEFQEDAMKNAHYSEFETCLDI